MAFSVYDDEDNLVFYSEQKAFKLREDIRVYSDKEKSNELLTIKTPQILDISATYNVVDSTSGEGVGALQRKGLKSILKDEWLFLDVDGNEIGKLTESSTLAALATRFLSNLIPQKYVVTDSSGVPGAEIKQHFNPFVLKYTMTMQEAAGKSLDPRLLLASGILLCGIERRLT